jgi:hypothetical protein
VEGGGQGRPAHQEVEVGCQGEEGLVDLVCSLLSWGPLYIGGGKVHLNPSPSYLGRRRPREGPRAAAARARAGQPSPRNPNPSRLDLGAMSP